VTKYRVLPPGEIAVKPTQSVGPNTAARITVRLRSAAGPGGALVGMARTTGVLRFMV
jgi:hypothetical protein